MLRNLLFFASFFGWYHAICQVGVTAVKPADSQIDYKLMGAPMPPIRYALYYDSIAKKVLNGSVAKNDDTLKKQASTNVKSDAGKNSNKRSKKKRKNEQSGTSAPGDLAENKTILTNKDLDNEANLFVMMFNPTCSHCEEETIMLGKNSALFKRSKVALIANPILKAYFGDFIKYTHADQIPFMYLGVDSSAFTEKVYLYRALPQINIYDKNRKLIKTFAGEVAIDSLSKYIE